MSTTAVVMHGTDKMALASSRSHSVYDLRLSLSPLSDDDPYRQNY